VQRDEREIEHFLNDKFRRIQRLANKIGPKKSRKLLTQLQNLDCPLTITMESTGTYRDTLSCQFGLSGFAVYQISAKRISDAREIYEGVPSLHNAISATVITHPFLSGKFEPTWRESR
jgi:hypothetical protein